MCLSGYGEPLAGIVQSAQVHTALARYGPFGTELDMIAAIIPGGTNILGNTESVTRTLLGVFLGIVHNDISHPGRVDRHPASRRERDNRRRA